MCDLYGPLPIKAMKGCLDLQLRPNFVIHSGFHRTLVRPATSEVMTYGAM